MIKILDLNIPLITTYPQVTNLLAIISKNDDYLHWFFENSTQLYCHVEDIRFPLVSFYPLNGLQKTCPFIEYNTIEKTKIDKNHFIEFLCDSIDKGFYVQVVTDSFYISAYENIYRKSHRSHEMLIFGYNLKSQTFKIADFFENKYSFEDIPYSELLLAYEGLSKHDLYDEFSGNIELLKYKKISMKIELNPETFIKQINDYISPVNIVQYINKKRVKKVIGINVYDHLIKHIEAINKDVKVLYEVRSFNCIVYHKEVIGSIIKLLEDRNDKFRDCGYSQKYQEITNISLTLLNSFVKFLLKKHLYKMEDKGSLYRIIDRIEILKFKELEILNSLLDSLDHCFIKK